MNKQYPKNRKPAKFKNTYEVGVRFKKFVLIERIGYRETGGRKSSLWSCLCDCGRLFEADVKNIARGKVSCSKCILSWGKRLGKYDANDPKTVPYRAKYTTYRNAAKDRDLSFELSEDDAFKLFAQRCHYCLVEPFLDTRPFTKGISRNIFANGIDRIDSSKGYALDNMVPCCHFCNRAKGDMIYSEFIDWIKKVRQVNE